MSIRHIALVTAAIVSAVCTSQIAAAESTMPAGIYSFGSAVYSGFDNSNCANAVIGYGWSDNDAKLYFSGMGKAGSRIDFVAWLYPKPYAQDPPLPYGPGVIEVILPTAPATDMSTWSGEATFVYHLIPGIYDFAVNPAQPYTKPVFSKQSVIFSFTYHPFTQFTGASSLALKLADGCNFYVASSPANTISPPYILQRAAQ